METLRIILMLGLVFLPSLAFARTDCRVVDFPDHYEVVCTGDEKAGPVQDQTTARAQTYLADQEAARVQAIVTAQANVDKAPVVHRLSRRPDQAGQTAFAEAKAARNRLILEERQKEPVAIEVAVPVTMQEENSKNGLYLYRMDSSLFNE